MIKIMNLTPHTIYVRDEEGNVTREYRPEATPARVRCETVATGESIDGVPVTKTRYFDVQDLPEAQPDTYYIVSMLLAQACPDRHDLLTVNETVRDGEGRIIGCKSFVVN